MLPNTSEEQQRNRRRLKVGHYLLRDKLRVEIVHRCKHCSIERGRHQLVHDRKRRDATRGEHCQQLIVQTGMTLIYHRSTVRLKKTDRYDQYDIT